MLGLRRLPFTGQIFLFLTIMVLLLIGLVATLFATLLATTLSDEYGQRSLAIARAVAIDPEVIAAATAHRPGGELQKQVLDLTRRTGALYVTIADDWGIRLAHPNPEQVGHLISTNPAEALAGREVIGAVETGTLGQSVRSKTPIRAADGRVVGVVSVGYALTAPAREIQRLRVLLGVFALAAAALGLAACWLLSRRLRRLTHGVEPRELTEMLYEHEAVLHGIREGVLAVDPERRILVRNAEAERLLGVPLPPGTWAGALPLSPRLQRALEHPPADNVLAVADNRVLVINSRAVDRGGQLLGTVLTLRDRTDLDTLTRELDAVRSLTDDLRAQRHEYSNRLHTLSGLLQLGHHTEAQDYLQALTETGAGQAAEIDASIQDPHLRALLLAKTEQAHQRGILLGLAEESSVPGHLDHLVPVLTLLGNVLDNALQAAYQGERRPPWVEVTLRADGSTLRMSVRDSGGGVTVEPSNSIFDEGVSTKSGPGHGLGLALARHEARRLGGELWLAEAGGSGSGAVFSAAVPGVVGRSNENGAGPTTGPG